MYSAVKYNSWKKEQFLSYSGVPGSCWQDEKRVALEQHFPNWWVAKGFRNVIF
jgi:hypothetical protein